MESADDKEHRWYKRSGLSNRVEASFCSLGDNTQGRETTGENFLAYMDPRVRRPHVPVVIWFRDKGEKAIPVRKKANGEWVLQRTSRNIVLRTSQKKN